MGAEEEGPLVARCLRLLCLPVLRRLGGEKVHLPDSLAGRARTDLNADNPPPDGKAEGSEAEVTARPLLLFLPACPSWTRWALLQSCSRVQVLCCSQKAECWALVFVCLFVFLARWIYQGWWDSSVANTH